MPSAPFITLIPSVVGTVLQQATGGFAGVSPSQIATLPVAILLVGTFPHCENPS